MAQSDYIKKHMGKMLMPDYPPVDLVGTGYTRSKPVDEQNTVDAGDWPTVTIPLDEELNNHLTKIGWMEQHTRKTSALETTPPDTIIDLSTQPPIASGDSFTLPTDDE